VEFVVGVNTHALEPGRPIRPGFDINMDDVISRVPLSVQVVDKTGVAAPLTTLGRDWADAPC